MHTLASNIKALHNNPRCQTPGSYPQRIRPGFNTPSRFSNMICFDNRPLLIRMCVPAHEKSSRAHDFFNALSFRYYFVNGVEGEDPVVWSLHCKVRPGGPGEGSMYCVYTRRVLVASAFTIRVLIESFRFAWAQACSYWLMRIQNARNGIAMALPGFWE